MGVTPSSITVEDAAKGVTFEKTITIINTAEDACDCNVSVKGDLKDWFSFHEVGQTESLISITVPGKGSKRVVIKITIPEDTPNGVYNDTIYVQTIPSAVTDAEGTVASVVIRMPVRLSIAVTDIQILTGIVKSITTQDTEVGYPLRINVVFKNTGNVVAKPNTDVKITNTDGQIIDRLTRDDFEVKVGSTDTIPVEWNTNGLESGDYVANVTVSLGGEVLATQKLHFKLLPVGTLSRQGSLTDISYDGEPSVDKVTKILATFKNIGEIDTKAKFIGEVYVNGDLIDTIESEELLVPVRETDTLTVYLKIEKDGSYTIKGHVLYDGKTTETKELSFIVTEAELETGKVPRFGIIGALMAIAILVVFIVARRKLLKK